MIVVIYAQQQYVFVISITPMRCVVFSPDIGEHKLATELTHSLISSDSMHNSKMGDSLFGAFFSMVKPIMETYNNHMEGTMQRRNGHSYSTERCTLRAARKYLRAVESMKPIS